jgi:hypothetical protein
MWIQYRLWKHALILPLAAVAWGWLREEPELGPKWKTGVIIALCLGVAYLAEEIFWMTKRQGRPCGHCGQQVRMKSFRMQTNCPHCGQPLE